MFFKFQRRFPDGRNQFGAFFVRDMASGALRCFGRTISGHPCWMHDGRAILNVMPPEGWIYTRGGKGFDPVDGSRNRWLVVVDAETGAYERLVDLPIEGPGHPIVSPDGRWIVTDAFRQSGRSTPIYVIEIRTGIAREIIRLDHHFSGASPTALTRGQPHPAWSPDGREVYVNCNHGGRAMEPLILYDFLP